MNAGEYFQTGSGFLLAACVSVMTCPWSSGLPLDLQDHLRSAQWGLVLHELIMFVFKFVLLCYLSYFTYPVPLLVLTLMYVLVES